MSQHLSSSNLFNRNVYSLPNEERARLSLAKARAIASAYDLTLDDIGQLSPKFWRLHCDPIMCADGAATTLLTIQYNLVIGTILDHAGRRPDLDSLLQDLLQYRICGQFCLTELDHGLDAINVETTATALPNDGGFILHSPHTGAAKYMPPTIPCGIPCIAVVMARLLSDGVDYGVKPFLVHINDGRTMCSGISARLLPPRGGSSPVNHALTLFDQVHLPRSALLGRQSLDRDDKRIDYLMSIWRVAIGSLSLGATTLPALGMCAFITAKYSQRRLVGAGKSTSDRIAIIHFKTQQTPILTAFAQFFVLHEFFKFATTIFSDDGTDFRVRHGIATTFKVTSLKHMLDGALALSERCGAQGLFGHNRICELHSDVRGLAIAEGDLLVISIRLVSELVLNRYSLPASPRPNSPLSLHENGLLSECRIALKDCGNHRSESFNRFFLPRCQPIVEAIGQRLAYDAAVDAGLDGAITELYLAAAMKQDAVWYSENLGLTQQTLFAMEDKALKRAWPKLGEWMDMSGVERYAKAPILSSERWSSFAKGLKMFSSPPISEFYPERSRL